MWGPNLFVMDVFSWPKIDVYREIVTMNLFHLAETHFMKRNIIFFLLNIELVIKLSNTLFYCSRTRIVLACTRICITKVSRLNDPCPLSLSLSHTLHASRILMDVCCSQLINGRWTSKISIPFTLCIRCIENVPRCPPGADEHRPFHIFRPAFFIASKDICGLFWNYPKVTVLFRKSFELHCDKGLLYGFGRIHYNLPFEICSFQVIQRLVLDLSNDITLRQLTQM